MYQSLALFQTATAMARHAGAQQAVTSQNIAHADTPGYRARQMHSFQEVHARGRINGPLQTRQGHMGAHRAAAGASAAAGEPSPNGNSVSVEEQMLQAVDNARTHKRALTIYRHALTVLRTTLSR